MRPGIEFIILRFNESYCQDSSNAKKTVRLWAYIGLGETEHIEAKGVRIPPGFAL